MAYTFTPKEGKGRITVYRGEGFTIPLRRNFLGFWKRTTDDQATHYVDTRTSEVTPRSD